MTSKLCMMLVTALVKDAVDSIRGPLHSFEKSSTHIKPGTVVIGKQLENEIGKHKYVGKIRN